MGTVGISMHHGIYRYDTTYSKHVDYETKNGGFLDVVIHTQRYWFSGSCWETNGFLHNSWNDSDFAAHPTPTFTRTFCRPSVVAVYRYKSFLEQVFWTSNRFWNRADRRSSDDREPRTIHIDISGAQWPRNNLTRNAPFPSRPICYYFQETKVSHITANMNMPSVKANVYH